MHLWGFSLWMKDPNTSKRLRWENVINLWPPREAGPRVHDLLMLRWSFVHQKCLCGTETTWQGDGGMLVILLMVQKSGHHHLGCIKNPVNNGMNYILYLFSVVSRISSINSTIHGLVIYPITWDRIFGKRPQPFPQGMVFFGVGPSHVSCSVRGAA